jgi:hypothetical protein
VLREAQLPVPMDNPSGVYAFEVRPTWDGRISRTIELQSEHALDDLHAAIQRSIGWDSDHLYSFFMDGVMYDRPYAFACPKEDDHPPWTDEAVLGELGLVLDHPFKSLKVSSRSKMKLSIFTMGPSVCYIYRYRSRYRHNLLE